MHLEDALNVEMENPFPNLSADYSCIKISCKLIIKWSFVLLFL